MHILINERIEKFLRLSETRLINLGYRTYKPGEVYGFEGKMLEVKENELLLAVKE